MTLPATSRASWASSGQRQSDDAHEARDRLLGHRQSLGGVLQLLPVHPFALGNTARCAAAHGFFHMADGDHHVTEFRRQETDLVIIAFLVAVISKMLLNNFGAHGHGSDGNGITTLMA